MAAKKFIYGRKKAQGHKSTSRSTSYDALSTFDSPGGLSTPTHGHLHHKDDVEMTEKDHVHDHTKVKEKKRKRKAMTSVIIDQLGEAIGAVALKNSKFNQQGEFGSMHSARKLARKLFSTLSDVRPSRNLIVTGSHQSNQAHHPALLISEVLDFYPYFPTHEEAVNWHFGNTRRLFLISFVV